MVTCKLRDKEYRIDYISGRALREIEPASKMYAKLRDITEKAANGEKYDDRQTVAGAMDVLVHWFCILFNNQFTADEVYDNYPSDRLMHDVCYAIIAVQTNLTEVLKEFPLPVDQPKMREPG